MGNTRSDEEFKYVRCASIAELQRLCKDRDRSCEVIVLFQSLIVVFGTFSQISFT